jgi:NTE family protein
VESRERAREKLESFWRRVSATGAIFRRAADVSGFELLSRALSPYQFNPFNLDPLREALEETVDFDALRRASPVRLMIAATRVSDGHPRIFDEREISVDVVLASAALPLMRQAVTVDGEPFWDGGFAANPPLLALAHETRARDILVVQLTPAHVEELPRSRKDIKRRLEQISLNSTLNVELEALRLGARVGATRRLRDLRVHRVAAEDSFDALAERSAVDLDWSFLSGLRDAGRRAAEKWRHEDMHFAKA